MSEDHGTALSFFKSCLEDKTQVVSVLGFNSDPSTLSCGVLQGSVLDSILFMLCTQALSDIARHLGLHHTFNDDTELYKSVSRDHIPSLLDATYAV